MYHFGSGSCLTGADLTDLERIAKVPQQHSRRTTENKNIGNIGEYDVYYTKMQMQTEMQKLQTQMRGYRYR